MASSRELGLLINSLLRDITLSAPKTSSLGNCLLTLIDFSSARFLEINWGSAPSACKDNFA